jgi:integrase
MKRPERRFPFTQARIDALPFDGARAVLYDAAPDSPRGFALRISSKSKVYYVLATLKGKGRLWVRLGDALQVKLKDARVAAWRATGKIAHGTDVNAEARRQREEAAAKAKPSDEWTVEDMVRAFMKARPLVSESTTRNWTWLLERRIAPGLKMHAREVMREDIRREIGVMAKRSQITAIMALRLLRTAFRWAMDEEVLVTVDGKKIARARIDRDPTRKIEREIGLPSYRPRKRHLSDAEIPVYWKAIEELGPRIAMFLRLIILSGTRSTETHRAKWDDIDLGDPAAWHIPARNRKGRAEGTPGERRHMDVPLSPFAVKLLETFRPLSGNKERVFVDVDPRRVGAAAVKVSRLPRVTIHDLRRTCSTGLQRIGCPPHVISVVLGHAREAGATQTDAAYTHDRRESEHRLWLERWAEHVNMLVSQGGDLNP